MTEWTQLWWNSSMPHLRGSYLEYFIVATQLWVNSESKESLWACQVFHHTHSVCWLSFPFHPHKGVLFQIVCRFLRMDFQKAQNIKVGGRTEAAPQASIWIPAICCSFKHLQIDFEIFLLILSPLLQALIEHLNCWWFWSTSYRRTLDCHWMHVHLLRTSWYMWASFRSGPWHMEEVAYTFPCTISPT